jgi:uncharacterized protein
MSTSNSHRKHAFTVWALIAIFGLTALFATYMLFVEAPPSRTMVIATGSKAGAYYHFAEKYADVLRDQGITLKVRETKGAVENLQLLNDDSSGVAVAIVQSGVSQPEDRENLLALGSLYREPLWVFYRGEKALFVEALPPKKAIIATGGKAGAYYHFAEKYAEELKKEGFNLEVRETNGSVENLQLLKDDTSGVAAAIVQSGVAEPRDRERLAALGSLYREPLWLFMRGSGPAVDLGIGDLKGRIGVGPPGSGTYAVALQLLAANGLVNAEGESPTKATLIKDSVTDAAGKLKKGELDAAFFVAAFEAAYIQDLLKDPNVRLVSFSQHEAYHRKFRFLSPVILPTGLINLGQNLPPKDMSLLAPTAMLVVRKDAHPTLTSLLLAAAAQVHGKGDQLSNPGEFPSASYIDLPLSVDAKSFYRSNLNVQRQPPIDRLGYLEGKRIGVGPPGSGTHAIAVQLLNANGLDGKATLTMDPVKDAADKLLKGELDAAFFVAAIETDYVKKLMNDPYIRPMSFSQHEAYQRKFRFLSEVTVPAGLVSLGHNIPRQDIALVAPTAMLVVRKDMHPALISLLLTTATRVHGKGDELTNPGEFPSASFTDIPISDDAKHFYKFGPPVLQRLLPFWLASLADRLKIMLIPLVMLLMPLVRAAPPLVRWRTRRKIYLWYSALRDIDKKLALGLAGPALEEEIARLKEIDHQVAFVEVPLSYMEEFYHLRLHLTMMQQTLEKLRGK